MSFHDLIVKRRSIRRYEDKSLSADDVRNVIEAGLMAPSSKMSRPWHFILVEDKELLAKMSRSRAAGGMPVEKCVLAVVVCADSRMTGAWIEDASIAATFIQLQAQDLGLGSCWVQVRDRFDAQGEPTDDIIRSLLGIPEEISVECIVTLGYPDEQKKPQDTEKLLWEQVHVGKW